MSLARNGDVFLTPQRVLGARSMLTLLIQTLFFIKWHAEARTHEDLGRHYRFAEELTRPMQREGIDRARRHGHDERAFYMGDVSFVSMNWDPVGLWCQFVANRTLKRQPGVPHIGVPAVKLRIFHDLAHFVAGPRITSDPAARGTPWQPMNESSARQLNDADHGAAIRVRIGKYLFPHGCLWWRECPSCGKLSSYDGDRWDVRSPSLLAPPPLQAFVDLVGTFAPSGSDSDDANGNERQAWARGRVDARRCVHCRTLTHAHHSPLLMQSNFKSPPPPFVEEVQRDMRVVLEKADHIVLMGYSLPRDDVTYRALLAARQRRAGDARNNTVRCSVVVGHGGAARWAGPGEWPAMVQSQRPDGQPREVLESVSELLGKENVRFYGAGIPQVFMEGGDVTSAAVERLLVWRD